MGRHGDASKRPMITLSSTVREERDGREFHSLLCISSRTLAHEMMPLIQSESSCLRKTSAEGPSQTPQRLVS